VTTLLMHEAMRTPDAQQIAADTSRSALFQLLDIANKRAAGDMRAQKLREVADASLKMLDEAIAAAPVLTYKDLLPLLTKWKSPYPITLGFTDPELEAFQNLTAYLTNNPRHIKRLVNTYSLIRMLAAQAPNGELVVNAPEATLKWLILSSQWPLTSQAMLRAFYEELEKMSVDDVLPKDDDALARLAQKAHERIAADPGLQKQRARLDGDLGVLKKLIEGSLNVLTSAQLNLLRAYSINFNPAEGDLSPLTSEKIAEASESKPQPAKADVHPE
jgi:hypothetical protein